MIDAARATEPPTAPPPILSHPVMTAAQGMFLILNAASLRRLPLPFAASAYDHQAAVDFQFRTRAEVITWAAALQVAEVIDKRHDHATGPYDHTYFETVWLDVPIMCAATIGREPR